MNTCDQWAVALCAWKENRHGGIPGMTSVINVIMNRARAKKTTPYAEVFNPLQFSSMSYQHDRQLLVRPDDDDPQWDDAQGLAVKAATGKLADITGGATSYYAETIPEPGWAFKMIPTVVIAGQKFFKNA